MAVLLRSRSPGPSVIVLAIFVIAVRTTLPSARLRRDTFPAAALIRAGSETTGQTTVRLTVLLLVTLSTVAILFDLDIVLGAFAAGFVLHRALPEGDQQLEAKLTG